MQILILIIAGLVVAAAWRILDRTRERIAAEIAASDAGLDKKLELQVNLDTEMLKLRGGAVVVIGVALTAIQVLDARWSAEQEVLTARRDKAFEMLGADEVGPRVGGVQTFADLDTLDGENSEDRYRLLLLFAHLWSPYHSDRTTRCLAPGLGVTPANSRDILSKPSVRIDPATQTVLTAVAVAGGSKRLPRIDLSATNLSEAEFGGVNLSGANLTVSDLSGARMTDADLSGGDLFCANLYRTDLTGVDATHANLPSALMMEAVLGPPTKLRASDFTDATMNSVDLRNAKLCGAILRGAELRHADLSAVVAYDADFRGTDLTDTSFFNAELAGAKFDGVVFGKVAKGEDAFKPNLTCANLSATKVPPEDYCGSTEDHDRQIEAASFPEHLRGRFTLCRTRIAGAEVNTDCPRDGMGKPILPDCVRDHREESTP